MSNMYKEQLGFSYLYSTGNSNFHFSSTALEIFGLTLLNQELQQKLSAFY